MTAMPKWETKPWSIANCCIFVRIYVFTVLFVCAVFSLSLVCCFKIENYINKKWMRNGNTEREYEREGQNKKSWKYILCVRACDSMMMMMMMIHKQCEAACCLVYLFACLFANSSKSKKTFVLIEEVNVSICVFAVMYMYLWMCFWQRQPMASWLHSTWQNECVCVCQMNTCQS